MDALDAFQPAVAAWFRARYGEPTPPQVQGWPAIQRGEHTLILSPTGSGKTMAAFLWGIDRIYRDLAANPDLRGVQLVYVSPLKALNNDIERNLREPLAGIQQTAQALGLDLPPLRVAVRTGDTPSSERQRMLRQPPHILITTPESLYLLLTSVKACAILDTAHTVIVDEIHTLCGNKRGVHLALTLERLGCRTAHTPQRIGLSATQRPLDEVARFLGGQAWVTGDDGQEQLQPRPVTIVDAGARKALDIKVVTVLPDLRKVPGGSVWPFVIPDVLNEIRMHRTTLVFTNSRRGAERAADRLNEQYAVEAEEEVEPGSPAVLMRDGVGVARGMFGTGRSGGPFRAHHGSVSKEVRLELEHKLKAGELPALIGTSSLELGIDIGYVDEVIQLESPHSVARGLQRVGRSGHLVGQTSVGRIYPLYREDLLDAGAVAHGMLHGDIEPTYTPRNSLDVLAQQIVAMVGMDDWDVTALYRRVRQAYGYHELSRDAYVAVLDMLSGKYPSADIRELRPRISWDRVNDKLAALPGTRLLAVRNGGTIPDQGQFNVYLPDGKTILGSLDEEFVFETRPGDVFTLGSSTWRVTDIDENKLTVAPAEGQMPRMPFWHGEAAHRDYDMGLQVGAFRRQLAERAVQLPAAPEDPAGDWPNEARPILDWLMADYAMDENSARNALHYVRHQLDVAGAISSDDTVVVEQFSDALGDQRVAIHSCFGGRVNSAWALALSQAMRERLGRELEVQVDDDGILFRIAQADREPPLELVRTLGPEEARERLLTELPNAAMFGAHFRMNAARALLLPGTSGKGRTPFWLQRLRAKDLLAVVKGYQDFPIIAETMRDCLRDVLDLEHLMTVLERIRSGAIRVIETETVVPSPVASALLFDFANVYLYDHDLPKAERQIQALAMNRELLAQLLDEGMLPDLLRPEAIAGVERELQHLAEGYQARSVEELAVVLHELGDLSSAEVAARCLGDGAAWLSQLVAEGRIVELPILTSVGVVRRWVATEERYRYRTLDAPETTPEEVRAALLRALTRVHGPLTLEAIEARYAFPREQLEAALDALVDSGHLLAGRLSPGAARTEWCDRRVLERIHQRTLSLLRHEIRPVSLPAYADFQVRWQHAHPALQLRGESGLATAVQQLRGVWAPAVTWERDLFPVRVEGYLAGWLDALVGQDGLIWVASGGEARRAQATLFYRGEGQLFLATDEPAPETLSDLAWQTLETLRAEGACSAAELRGALGVQSSQLDDALVELALAGLVTNDQYAALRRIVSGEGSQPECGRGVESSLDAELDAWRAARAPTSLSRPPASRMRQARREVGQRMATGRRWPGQWSAVQRLGVLGAPLSDDERAARQAQVLLQRVGIVTRTALEREPGPWVWGALYRQLQLMEMRGDVRRGYFVLGLPGVQFALPEALEALRAWDKPEVEGGHSLVLLNACDPANIYGATETLPAAESGLAAGLARLPSNYLVLQRGVPVLTYEHGSARWTTLPQADDVLVARAVQLCLAHLTREGGLCSRPRRVFANEWNGATPLGSAAQPLLESLGFRREPPGMVWDGM